MNNKDLLKAIGEIDDKYLIEDNRIKEKNRIRTNNMVSIMKKIKIGYALIPICIVLITIVGFNLKEHKNPIDTNEKDKQWILKEVSSDLKYSDSIATEQHWNEKPINKQYDEIEFNSNKYFSKTTKVESNKISEKLGEAILTGYDSDTNTYKKINGDVYLIDGVSKECVIAIKFENDNNYYVYQNNNYKPLTLKQIIEDLNLHNNIYFSTVHYNYYKGEQERKDGKYTNVEFYEIDNAKIWELLFDDVSLENVYNDKDLNKYIPEYINREITIDVDNSVLGNNYEGISLTDNGYLLTNILGSQKAFYIGKEKIDRFLDYIIENYDGYEIVYVNKEENNTIDEESNLKDDKIVMTENTVNGYVTKEIETDKMTSNENKTEPYIPNN